jgi:hypothetical protein
LRDRWRGDSANHERDHVAGIHKRGDKRPRIDRNRQASLIFARQLHRLRRRFETLPQNNLAPVERIHSRHADHGLPVGIADRLSV